MRSESLYTLKLNEMSKIGMPKNDMADNNCKSTSEQPYIQAGYVTLFDIFQGYA